ncbi:MAG: ribose-phosphate pyrophosphokinase-like domain-containing protein [Nanoarchaeota archaeon]|nr:ribose-phosphate pyrophosphokinase-like domain-containing protein [Nanoarchaeota archaeon]
MIQTKLLLIPASGGETTQLAQQIHDILRIDYGMENQVEILESRRRSDIDKDMPKAHRHPLVSDYFPDGEAQVDIGSNELKDVIRGKHVALVEHLLTPARKMFPEDEQKVSVNDHLATVRGFLNVFKNGDTLQRTLVSPYLAYVRSHSIEKYRKRGFYQYDSLREMLQDLHKGGLDAINVIDPHSIKAQEIAEELGIDYHAANPFQSARAINPAKLGLSGDKAKEVLKRLRPFQERFAKMKEQKTPHLYLISVDDGTERRVENFIERAYLKLPPEEVYALLGYMGKDRISYEHALSRFKSFSKINESNIDKDGTYIMIDDMYASGKTTSVVAKIFKDLGAQRVEVWTSHAVTMPMQYATANDRTSIDKVVSLDTVPQDSRLNIEYISSSADLLAAELYKTHQKLVALR